MSCVTAKAVEEKRGIKATIGEIKDRSAVSEELEYVRHGIEHWQVATGQTRNQSKMSFWGTRIITNAQAMGTGHKNCVGSFCIIFPPLENEQIVQ